MKQVLDMYRFVKQTKILEDSLSKMLDESNSPFISKGSIQFGFSTAKVKAEFKKRYKSYPYLHLDNVCDDAVEGGYLDQHVIVTTAGQRKKGEPKEMEVEQVRITKAGRTLIDTIPLLPFIPKGLLIAWYKEDGKLVIGMLSAIITLLGVIAVTLIKIAYQLHNG